MADSAASEWVTRTEAGDIIGCSDFKIRRWEKPHHKTGAPPRLHPEKRRGVYYFRRADIEALRDELEEEARMRREVDDDDEEVEVPDDEQMRDEMPERPMREDQFVDPRQAQLTLYKQDHVAAMVRAATSTIKEASSAHRSLFSYYEREVERLNTRIKELEAERLRYVETTEKYASRYADRELERRIVEKTILQDEKPATERIFEKTIPPLMQMLLHKFFGIKTADLKDPVVQKCRSFFSTIDDEQGGQIMACLRAEQQAMLQDLMVFIDSKGAKEEAEKKEAEKKQAEKKDDNVTDAEYEEVPKSEGAPKQTCSEEPDRATSSSA